MKHIVNTIFDRPLSTGWAPDDDICNDPKVKKFFSDWLQHVSSPTSKVILPSKIVEFIAGRHCTNKDATLPRPQIQGPCDGLFSTPEFRKFFGLWSNEMGIAINTNDIIDEYLADKEESKHDIHTVMGLPVMDMYSSLVSSDMGMYLEYGRPCQIL